MKNLVTKNPNAAYFCIAFGWTWLIGFAMIFSGIARDVSNPTPVFIIGGILSGFAPSAAAFIVTGATKGKEG